MAIIMDMTDGRLLAVDGAAAPTRREVGHTAAPGPALALQIREIPRDDDLPPAVCALYRTAWLNRHDAAD